MSFSTGNFTFSIIGPALPIFGADLPAAFFAIQNIYLFIQNAIQYRCTVEYYGYLPGLAYDRLSKQAEYRCPIDNSRLLNICAFMVCLINLFSIKFYLNNSQIFYFNHNNFDVL